MKVALFTDTFLPQINGVTNTLTKLIEYYKARNIEYLIFTPDSYDKLNENINIEKFISIKFILYPECRLSFPNVFRLKNSLLNFNPDIIHIMTEFNMGVAGLINGKKLGIPTVSNYTTNFAQYLKYYNLEILENASWNYMRWFHNQNNVTLCPSMETAKLLKNHDIENVGIFSRGIDSEKYNKSHRSRTLRKQLGIDDKIALLYVGRVAMEKDIDVLLKGYTKALEKYGDKISLIITGDGPELDRYKKSFPKGTIFTGYKKGHELVEIYASSDIFVFPSPTETFGNVVLEAMASGLPVIAANAGGVKDTVKNRINGLLFNTGDENQMFGLISEMIENKDLRNNLIKNADKTVSERTWESIFDGLINTYQEVIYNNNNNVGSIIS